MKRLLLKSLLLAFLVLASNLALAMSYLPEVHASNRYLQGLPLKHQALDNAGSPKIIFVGGSNLAFGLDSQQVQKEFGVPVVNMGLQGSLGMRFMLEEVKPSLEAGDVVILVPEYYHFFNSPDGSGRLFLSILIGFPQSIRFINTPNQVAGVLRELLPFHLNLLNQKAAQFWNDPLGRIPIEVNKGDYPTAAFNANGDLTSPLAVKPTFLMKKFRDAVVVSPPTSDTLQAVRLFNNFNSFAASRGARVFMIYPVIPAISVEKGKVFTGMLNQYLKEHLDFPVLGSPERYSLPNEEFYDTSYHLNIYGREKRTLMIIEDLKGVLARP